MGFDSVYTSRRVPRAAAEQATAAMHKIRRSARELLLEHARDHVKRTGGRLDCPLCVKATEAVRHVDEVLAGDYFV